MNFTDLITPGKVITYWDDSKADQSNYIGDYLFPPAKQLGIELTKIGGRAGVPVILKSSAFDTPTTFRDRVSVETRTTSMPYFKEGMTIDEKIRQQILQVQAGGNGAQLMTLMNNIFDDTNNLLRGARVMREYMAMSLLSTGRIPVMSNGVQLEYNYGIDENHQKVKASTDWSDTENAKPLQEIQDWVADFRIKYGVPLAGAILTSKTFGYLSHNKYLIKQLYPNTTDPSGIMIRNDLVKQLVQETTGVRLFVYDEIYATQVKGGNKKFFPDNVVTFIPAGTLGNMMFGTTPAEADMSTGMLTSSQVSITDTGVAVMTKRIDDPINIQTIVSQLCMPSFNSDIEGGAGSILIADVVA